MNEESNSTQGIKLNQNIMGVLSASIIPTSKYFEAQFDHLLYQLDELKAGQTTLLEVLEK
jgi:hypothetical protein